MPTLESLKVLYSEQDIAERIAELGEQITQDYKGKKLIMVAVLKGAFPFLADICRAIRMDVRVEFLGVSSYGLDTKSSGVVRITQDLTHPIEGADVLLVEDIVDTGLTLRYILDNMATRNPKSVGVCTLLDKPANRRVEVRVDYRGFTIPDHFVVGYGMDLAESFRNLPYIGYFPPETLT
jgi:hypoxanthine phosphoribosyltransferase